MGSRWEAGLGLLSVWGCVVRWGRRAPQGEDRVRGWRAMVHRLLEGLGKKERFIWFSSCSEALPTPGLCTAFLCRCRREGAALPPPPQQQ